MASILVDIQPALKCRQFFNIERNSAKDPVLEKRSLWNRFFHWGDTDYHTRRIERIAKVIAKSLGQMPRQTLTEAKENPALKTANKFLKKLSPEHRSNSKVKACTRQLLAAKLGIEAKFFVSNPGFEAFALDPPLEKYLENYGHNLKIVNDQEIQIFYNGDYLPWAEAQQKLQEISAPIPNYPDNPKQPWVYGREGVQNKDMYAWEKLEPYKIVDDLPPWGKRYIFEFCSTYGDGIQLNGDHTWLQLKTPNGEIYSAGLYRPGKCNYVDNFMFPMRAKKGYLMSPDFSEFWPMPVVRIPVEITEVEFNEIKHSIEQNKQNESQLTFQVFKGNCAEYVNEKAAIAGIHLPTSINVLRYVMPDVVIKVADKLMGYLPVIIQKICTIFAAVVINLMLHTLGAAYVDKQVKGVNIKIHLRPLLSFGGIRDLFDPSKLMFHPPRHFALDVCKEIDKWRTDEIDKITKGRPISELSQADRDAVDEKRFALQEEYKTTKKDHLSESYSGAGSKESSS